MPKGVKRPANDVPKLNKLSPPHLFYAYRKTALNGPSLPVPTTKVLDQLVFIIVKSIFILIASAVNISKISQFASICPYMIKRMIAKMNREWRQGELCQIPGPEPITDQHVPKNRWLTFTD
ncbi:hypothetical protein H4Q26_005315 [Puccinia striiformis f. sp. tritici PST-130]|nr:hypothetical protein H4Q26_005315 [Puccinia striiformis f. sp. tritici PST-130]